MIKKFATTFGGSEFIKDSKEYKEAIRLGEFLAHRGYTVKCGGYYGLMEAVAKGVQNASGECIGITNTSFDPKPANRFITAEVKAIDLFDRLRLLISESELFVVQVGSLGTLVEFSLVWCLKYVEILPNVEIFLIGRCWRPVIEGLKNLNIKAEFFSYIAVCETIDQFIKAKRS